jgi:hypothetical protein
VASPDSWLAYERAVLFGRRGFAESLSDNERQSALSRAEEWFSMYELHGQSCLGFVAYVAREANPPLNRSANGRPPDPRGGAVYHPPRGPGVLPLSPA